MISLSRAMAEAALDEVFLKSYREVVGRALASRDVRAFTEEVFALHRDFSRAARIIDNNLPEW